MPKGIVYDHRWVFGCSWTAAGHFNLGPGSRCLLRCSYVWSVSLYDLFPATISGGTLVIPPKVSPQNLHARASVITGTSGNARLAADLRGVPMPLLPLSDTFTMCLLPLVCLRAFSPRGRRRAGT